MLRNLGKIEFSNKETRIQFIAIFAMILITASSNYLVEVPVNNWLTWGAFTYPFTFLVTELMNRFYGPRKARQVVYVGFLTAIVLGIIWMNRRIAIASCLAFLVGQLTDITIFNRLRRKSWWIAPGVASISATFLDTSIFFSLAFVGTEMPWFQLAVGDFIVKLGVDFCSLLPFRLFLWKRRRGSLPFAC